MFWKNTKRIEERSHGTKRETKDWYTVFHKVEVRTYPNFTNSVQQYIEFKPIKTSMVCVCLGLEVHYECEKDGKILFLPEKDLRFPTKNCEGQP